MRGDNTKVVAEPLKVAGKKLEITCVSMGNPHCVTFVDHVGDYPVEKIGPDVEKTTRTSRSGPTSSSSNDQPAGDQDARMGARRGETSRAHRRAAAVASMLNDKVSRKVTVHLRGGDLFIEWLGDNKVFMTGPAEEVFEGKVSAGEMKKWTAES